MSYLDMPQAHFDYNDDELAALERVRASQGLGSLDHAAEWLVTARLRRVAMKLCGRNRALYPVTTLINRTES